LRGLFAGAGLAWAVHRDMFQASTGPRLEYGLEIGLLASVGVNLIRDAVAARKPHVAELTQSASESPEPQPQPVDRLDAVFDAVGRPWLGLARRR